jgi:hypothetical protein
MTTFPRMYIIKDSKKHKNLVQCFLISVNSSRIAQPYNRYVYGSKPADDRITIHRKTNALDTPSAMTLPRLEREIAGVVEGRELELGQTWRNPLKVT